MGYQLALKFALARASHLSTMATAAAVMIPLLVPEVCLGQYVIHEVMSGLITPRGLAWGPGGALYVAEAGSGGNGPSVILGNGSTGFLGATSGLSRLLGGVQERVLSGLPSVANAAGMDAGGLQDIVFDGNGQAFGLFGFGSDALQRDFNLGSDGAALGTIAQLPLSGTGALQLVADIAAHEFAANPAGGTIDSNPFGLTLSASGDLLVADAGGNDFLNASFAGVVATLGVLPARPNPLPFGPPRFQPVPTAITVGPDGAYYIGQLTGFPFPPNAANIYRFDPATKDLTIAHSGFTNIVDLTFGDDGNLYVLQITTHGIGANPGPGALFKVDTITGIRTLIADEGLVFPGSVLAGPDGSIYVSNHSNVPTGGQVLRLTPVPEPTSLVLFTVGGAIMAAGRRRLRQS